jgi:hypothetical protein
VLGGLRGTFSHHVKLAEMHGANGARGRFDHRPAGTEADLTSAIGLVEVARGVSDGLGELAHGGPDQYRS